MLLNPVTLRVIFFASLVVCLLGVFEYGKYTQHQDDLFLIEANRQVCKGEKAQLVLDYQLKVDAANQQARNKELELQQQFDLVNRQALKERQNAQNKIAELTARINAGSIKLYFPTVQADGAWSKLPSANNSTFTSGTTTEGRAELLPATATALVSLGAGCDELVRERNRLIDLYEAVRLKFKVEK